MVSNHIGWADILVHMCHYFPSFVAREETASLPFIGVCWCGRTPGRRVPAALIGWGGGRVPWRVLGRGKAGPESKDSNFVYYT